MKLTVQKQIPANTEGNVGELRVVNVSNGMFLYVKGYNHWGYLKLTNSLARLQEDRNKRRDEQLRTRAVIGHDGDESSGTAATHGDGTTAGGGSGRSFRDPAGPPLNKPG